MIFDDKSKGAIASEKALIYYTSIKDDELVFKATYYVVGNIDCAGKLSALFDLIVVGDLKADEADIKGKFVCTGKCQINKTLTVQNDIWADNLVADRIICHENCMVQELDAGDVDVEGNITVGKAFGIERIAQCNQRIICGETIYGAGKVITDMVITGDPIDLDEGEESLLPPNTYSTKKDNKKTTPISALKDCIESHKGSSDYKAFLKDIVQKCEPDEKEKAKHFLTVLEEVTSITSSKPKMKELHDARILLSILDLENSNWFEGWSSVQTLRATLLSHFESFAKGVFPYSDAPKHPKDLNIGDCVSHITFGKGKVTLKERTASGCMISVSFPALGVKKFIIPNSLDKFTIIKSGLNVDGQSEDTTIICKISGYYDWLHCLTVLYQNSNSLSSVLYNAIYDDLMSNLGLKAKYIADRFNEKGWNHYGQ